MAFDVQTLAAAATCAECLNQEQKQNVALYLLNQFVESGGGGGNTLHNLLSLTHPDTVPGPPLRGSLIVGNATPDWEALLIGAAGRVLRSDGTDATWSQVALTTDITGILPIANGGTNSSTALNNNRIMVSSAGSIVEAAALTNGQLLIGSTGAAPVAASLTAGANITITPGAGSITIASTVGTHTILDATVHTDSVTQAVTRGSLIYGNATPKWDELVIGAAGRFLGSDGTDTSWTALPGSFSGFANPTAQVGLVAVNGVATTAMRSDAAPSLDQGIVPTWTGAHTWTPPANTTPITVSGYSLTGANTQALLSLSGTWNTSGAANGIIFDVVNTASTGGSKLLSLSLDGVRRFEVYQGGFTWMVINDAIVNAAPVALEVYHNSTTGTPAANNGVGIDFSMDSNTTDRQFGGRWTVDWTVATHATRTARMRFYIASSAVQTEIFQMTPTLVSVLNSATFAVAAQNAIQISPFSVAAGNTSELRFLELAAGGTNYTGFKAADAMAASEIYVLPNAAPAANRFLQAAAVAGGVSVLSWAQVSLTADVTGILPVANGGTGTSTAFTAGSVIFAGAAGVFAQDNTNLFWDDTPNRLTVNQLNLPNTSSTAVGGIYFGMVRAIHNFGTRNFFAGATSGNLTMSGADNTGIGHNVLFAITTGSRNNAIGFQVLVANTTGEWNNGMGYQCLSANIDGGYNCAVGTNALTGNISGSFNTGVGTSTLQNNTTGGFNVAIGSSALLTNTTSSNSTAIGSGALQLSTGANNIGIGFGAGNNITTGANNIVIGYNIDSPAATNSNTLTIGNLIFGTGLDAAAVALSSGNIGIGVITPLAKLHVTNSAAATVGCIIKAAAAQSANLTCWQDSSAVILTKIDSVGNVGVRMAATALTAYLHIAAGTTAASTAPIKLTTGTSMTAAEAGAVEFTTDDLFFTITTGAARKRLLMADATAGLTSGKMPIATTNGRLIDLTASSAYTPTNVTPDRSYDANATSLDEIADALGSVIADLQAKGILG